MIADSLPASVVLDHLINSPYSLKNLGRFNVDGWGLAYFNDSEPAVLRGEPSAYSDPNFDLAAQELAGSNARIGVGHVRAATSGASDIPNPHPFIRYKGGKWWAFGHNGGLSKTILINLIGPEYLASNPPTVGDNWTDPRVVGSDLYMLYILKCTEENNWNATSGIIQAVTDISAVDSGAMNFFLTDGETLWGFRKDNTLYYYYNATAPQYSAIASQPPTSSQGGWVALNDYNLITLTIDEPPSILTVTHQLTGSISPTSVAMIVGQPIKFTSTTFGGYPPYSYQWCLNNNAVPDATSYTWTFTPTTAGTYVVYVNVTDSLGNVATSNEAATTIVPQLAVSISPISASIIMGQSVTFTSNTWGGFPPYIYQWYLDDSLVSGAVSTSWTFTSAARNGIYSVFLRVMDSESRTVQSKTAYITVTPLVGGSSSLTKHTAVNPSARYLATAIILVIVFATAKRKTVRKTR